MSAVRPAALTRVEDAIARADRWLGRFPGSMTQLVLRIAVALPFWRSGQTKWSGWLELSDSAVYLFEEEFRIHLFGQQYAYPAPQLIAYFSAAAEIVLPLMLVVGLGARFAALGLVLMTAFIQLTIPTAWLSHHLPWAAMALAVMTYGAGRFSLDHMAANLRSRRSA
jgi:putative oxidoreductase